MWLCISKSNEEIHVIPHNDLIEHTETEDCVCMPTATDIGEGQCMYNHNSLDGREHNEPDWKS